MEEEHLIALMIKSFNLTCQSEAIEFRVKNQ